MPPTADQSCPRLADYFVVVGPDTGEERMVDFGDSLPMVIVDRFPLDDWNDTPFMQNIPMFCFPSGASMRSSGEVPVAVNFVLDGALGHDEALYCAALVFHENYLGSNDAARNGISECREFFPKAICIVSHWPMFDLFNRILLEIYVLAGIPAMLPIERYIYHVLKEVPVPPMGEVAVQFYLGNARLCFARPSSSDMPLCPYGLESLFKFLGVGNIFLLFEALLLERKVLLVSRSASLRTAVGESMLSLIFPFHWQHMYFPVLPHAMVTFLHSWVPFFLGVDTGHLRGIKIPSDVVVVDLDANTVTGAETLPPLPATELRQLENRISTHLISRGGERGGGGDGRRETDSRDFGKQFPNSASNFTQEYGYIFGVAAPRRDTAGNPGDFCDYLVASTQQNVTASGEVDSQFVRSCFLAFFAGVFQDYRKFLVRTKFPQHQVPFNREMFLRRRPDCKEFLRALMETVAFKVFVSDRCMLSKHIYEVYIFDEAVESERRRDGKRDTLFLSRSRTTFSDIFQVSEINAEDEKLPLGPFMNSRFPKFQISLFDESVKVRGEMRHAVAGKFADALVTPPRSATAQRERIDSVIKDASVAVRLWAPQPSRQKNIGTLQGFIRWKSGDPSVGPPAEYLETGEREATTEQLKLAEMCVETLGQNSMIVSLLQRLPDHKANDLLLALLRIFGSTGAHMELIVGLIEYEIDSFSANSVSMLFRTNSYAARCLSAFLGVSAGVYLRAVLGPTLAEIVALKLSFEIDPARDPRLLDVSTLAGAVRRLEEFAEILFRRLFAAPIPPVLSKVCEHLHDTVEGKFHGLTQPVLSTVIFLRFISPALTMPEAFGLIPATPSPDARRGMVLLAKLVQLVANRTNIDDGKEAYLHPLKNFVEKMGGPMAEYMGRLAERRDVDFRDIMIIEEKSLQSDILFVTMVQEGDSSTPNTDSLLPSRDISVNGGGRSVGGEKGGRGSFHSEKHTALLSDDDDDEDDPKMTLLMRRMSLKKLHSPEHHDSDDWDDIDLAAAKSGRPSLTL